MKQPVSLRTAHLLVGRSFHSGDVCEPLGAHDARSTLKVGMSAATATDAPTDKEVQAAKRAIKRFNDPTFLAGEGYVAFVLLVAETSRPRQPEAA